MSEICEAGPGRKKSDFTRWKHNDVTLVANPSVDDIDGIVEHSMRYAAITTHNAINKMRWGL
jgi:hypothetical protein